MGKRKRTEGKHPEIINNTHLPCQDNGTTPTPAGIDNGPDMKSGHEINVVADLSGLDCKKNSMSLNKALKIINDLQTNQACLEKQNEALRRKLEKSLSRYAEHFENTSSGYLRLDSRGLILELNQAAADLLGTEKSALIKKSLSRFVVREDKVTFSLHRRKVLGSGGGDICEIRMRKKNGAECIAEIESRAVRDSSGGPSRISITLRDITRRRQVYNILQESRARFKELFSNINSGIAVYRPVGDGADFIFSDINKSGEMISGVKKDQVLGKSIIETIPALKEYGLLEVFRKVWKSGKPMCYPIAVYKDNRLSLSLDTYVYKLPAGEIAAVFYDVTKGITALEELQRFRNLVEQSSDSLFIIDPSTGRFLDVNEKACNSLGYEREELLSMTVSEIDTVFPGFHSWKKHADQLKKKKSMLMDGFHKRKDGTAFPVEVSLKYVSSVDNEYVIAVARDITNRRQTEEALRESEEQFRSLSENSNDCIMRYDRECRHTYVNTACARVTGIPAVDIIGKTHRQLNFDNEQCEIWEDKIRSVFKTGKPEQLEYEVDSPKGLIFFDWRIVPEFSHDGTVMSVLGVSRDITERKRAEILLQNSERKLREQKEALERKNITLREMMEQIDIEKRKIQEDIAINVEKTLLPILSKLKVDEDSVRYMDLLKHYLEELASSFGRKITEKSLNLTPKEIEICNMIKGGLTSKDICNILFISDLTVEKHRRNIRRKLGLSNKKINLASYLHNL